MFSLDGTHLQDKRCGMRIGAAAFARAFQRLWAATPATGSLQSFYNLNLQVLYVTVVFIFVSLALF